MSFHHAQPHKNNSSGNQSSNNCEPVDGWPQQIDDGCDASSVERSELSMASSDEYDEESRFELLSAYLDDEVTAEERQRVAQWLMDDPQTQQMYRRLLMLRQAIRTAPVPPQPPVSAPTPPPTPWDTLSSWQFHRVLVCAIAIALLGSLSQWGTIIGQPPLQEAWHFIKALPPGTLWEVASTENESPTGSHHNATQPH